MSENYFVQLNNVNVNDKTEKKGNLTYMSWAWAWGEVKKLYPDATYTIYERETENGPCFYFTDGKTAWVKTGVTINGIEHIEYLPIMDFKNKSIPVESVTSMDANKAIQRSVTKACARHGLGLYIYAGEDLPEDEAEATGKTKKKAGDEEPHPTVSAQQLNAIYKELERTGISESAVLDRIGKKHLEEATQADYISLMRDLNATPAKGESKKEA